MNERSLGKSRKSPVRVSSPWPEAFSPLRFHVLAGKVERADELTADERSEIAMMMGNAFVDYMRLHSKDAPHRRPTNQERNRAITLDWLAPANASKSLKAFAREWHVSGYQVRGITRDYAAECREYLADPTSMWLYTRDSIPYWRAYVAWYKWLVTQPPAPGPK